MTDFLLLAVFPYVALVLAVAVGLLRYFYDRFSYTSFSSQFLENRQLFWGSVPWHYSILILLLAHLLASLFPGPWAALFNRPLRLYILEVTGLALGFTALGAMGLLILRRISNRRLFFITSWMDWVLLADLFLQVASGLYVALAYRWGGGWYLYTAVPWLWSLVQLSPNVEAVGSLPFMVKFHMFNAFLLLALLPFSRLLHLFTLPITYLWRPYQLVIWNRQDRST